MKKIKNFQRKTKLSKEISRIGALQFALAFHKFIHNERNAESWNNLDEEAYLAALTGIFEIKIERK